MSTPYYAIPPFPTVYSVVLPILLWTRSHETPKTQNRVFAAALGGLTLDRCLRTLGQGERWHGKRVDFRNESQPNEAKANVQSTTA
eukprot:1196313-Prorocentrum_minimum.AAC.1